MRLLFYRVTDGKPLLWTLSPQGASQSVGYLQLNKADINWSAQTTHSTATGHNRLTPKNNSHRKRRLRERPLRWSLGRLEWMFQLGLFAYLHHHLLWVFQSTDKLKINVWLPALFTADIFNHGLNQFIQIVSWAFVFCAN